MVDDFVVVDPEREATAGGAAGGQSSQGAAVAVVESRDPAAQELADDTTPTFSNLRELYQVPMHTPVQIMS